MTNCPTNIQINTISFTTAQFELLKIALSKLEWAVFLESADENHIDSQWSIISAMPVATLQSSDGINTYQQGEIVESNRLDSFKYINEKRLSLFEQHKHLDNAPFVGGLLGAINYELGYQFEKITFDECPTALSLAELSIGFYDWALLLDHRTGVFSLATQHTKASAFDKQTIWQQRFEWLMAQLDTDMSLKPFKLLNAWQANMDKQQYKSKFDKIQDYILSGDCYQVNLAQRFNATYQGNEYQAYQALLADNRPPFAAFLRLPEQTILSLSPERFLKLNNNEVQSKPIKGTRPRFQDPVLDKQSQVALQLSEKDRSENLMIVDLLRNDIGRVCAPGTVKVPALFEIESFPAVHHLVSTVQGELAAQYQVEDLLRASFPGGSITGAPKIRSMEIIAELEPNRRQSYCGSIGYINGNGEMDMNIAIRTLICVDGKIYCWAGGGLVADSQIDAEYQECFDKVSKILPCLSALNTNE